MLTELEVCEQKQQQHLYLARTKESTLNEIANLFVDEYNGHTAVHILYHVHATQ